MVRGREIKNDPKAAELKQRVDLAPESCGREGEQPEEIFTVNGAVRPHIAIAPGERRFWRIVNASADRYLDLEQDPEHPTRVAEHVLLSPAGRLEAIVTGPAAGTSAREYGSCRRP